MEELDIIVTNENLEELEEMYGVIPDDMEEAVIDEVSE